MLRSIALAAFTSLATLAGSPASAESLVSVQHSAWQSCLHESFALKASLSGRVLAADAALRDCRESESAYLSALATSPLVDSEDASRVRPALVARARLWLLGDGRSRQL